MRARTFLASCLGFLAACGSPGESFVGELAAPVVYGTDDRREVFDHPSDELRSVAQESIVALITTSNINRLPSGDYSLTSFTLQDSRGLCGDEPFGNQPVAASCSGVLIADDLVLTAGHCISTQRPCENFNYVFNYYLDSPSRLALIRDEDVYSCERLALESDSPADALTPDFAVIQLDRPVEGAHAPVVIRPATALEEGEPISMIGFGSGLPAKIDSGSSVADPRADFGDFFVVNLDAFEGHSGSATFDSDDRLAGILLGGRVPDYVTDPGEGCARANVFDDVQAGEIVHNVAPIVAALCDEGLIDDELCAPDGCGGSPCGLPSVPGPAIDGDPAGVAGSGCSAAPGARETATGWMMLLLALAALRLRRTTA
jgi:MYXO-CTERM domain-containing protein